MSAYRLFTFSSSLALLFYLNSCSLLLNDPYKVVYFHTDKDVLVVHDNDSLLSTGEPLTLNLKRQKEDHRIIISTDSLRKEIAVSPHLSGIYWLNIGNYGLGYILDLTTQRRFTYPRHIFTDIRDTLVDYRNYCPSVPKGSIQLHVSVPEINYFHLQPHGLDYPHQSIGFTGICLGADYFYRDDYFIHSSVTAAADFFLPIPVPVSGWGFHESTASLFVNLTHGFRNQRFSHSHGLSLSRNIYKNTVWSDEPLQNQTTSIYSTSNAFGLYFDVYIQLNNSFHLGVTYRPSVWRFSDGRSQAYEHLMSLDLAWKLPL
ncbi:MAG: hypothetical protein RLP14_04975 [Owenweeksia sp.]